MKLKNALAFLMLVVASTAAWSVPPYPGMSPYGYPPRTAQPAAPTPDQIVKQGVKKLTGFRMPSSRQDASGAMAFLESQIAPHFDFETMARLSAGPLARSMNAEQKAQLTAMIKKKFLGTLVGKLGRYDQPQIQYTQSRGSRRSGEAVVSMRMIPRRGQPVALDFRFHRAGSGWKAYDVSINGSSAISYYRGYVAQMARQRGAGWLGG